MHEPKKVDIVVKILCSLDDLRDLGLCRVPHVAWVLVCSVQILLHIMGVATGGDGGYVSPPPSLVQNTEGMSPPDITIF